MFIGRSAALGTDGACAGPAFHQQRSCELVRLSAASTRVGLRMASPGESSMAPEEVAQLEALLAPAVEHARQRAHLDALNVRWAHLPQTPAPDGGRVFDVPEHGEAAVRLSAASARGRPQNGKPRRVQQGRIRGSTCSRLMQYAFVSQSGAGPERQSTCRARGRKSSRFFCAMQLRYAPIQKARRTRHSISKPLTPVWRCGHLSSTSPLFGSERHGSAYTCARSYRDTLRCVLPTFFNASSSRECPLFTAKG